MQYTYCNDNLGIFEGFYESALYNSDTEYYFNLDSDGPECGLEDFDGFKNKVGEAATELLRPMLERDGFARDVRFAGISSPMYYNYTTDKLLVEMDIDFGALREWVLGSESRRDGFGKYLAENYTSRSGFLSFVSNTVDGYFSESYDRYQDVLIDYYLLSRIGGSYKPDYEDVWESQYRLELIEMADGILWDYMVPIADGEDGDIA